MLEVYSGSAAWLMIDKKAPAGINLSLGLNKYQPTFSVSLTQGTFNPAPWTKSCSLV